MQYYCWNFHFCIPTLAFQTISLILYLNNSRLRVNLRVCLTKNKFKVVEKHCLNQVRREHYSVQNLRVWGLWENPEFCQRYLFAEVPTPPAPLQSPCWDSASPSHNPPAVQPKTGLSHSLIPHFV